MESSMEVMSQLSDIYIRNNSSDKGANIVNEMERLEEEFHSAYETVWESMKLWKFNKSSVKSMDPLQGTSSMEKSMSESIPKKEKLKEQTVSQGNIHEPESHSTYWRRSLEAV